MATNLLEDLGLDSDIFDILEDASAFTPSGRTFTLKPGIKVPFRGTIGTKDYECYAKLGNAKSVRLSLIDHEVAAEGGTRKSNIVSGVIRPMRLDLTIVEDGTEITFAEFLLNLANEPRIAAGKQPFELEDFGVRLGRMGIPLMNLPEYGYESSMPMLWQHFGPELDVVNAMFDAFESAGAVDVLPPPARRKRLTRAVEVKGGFQIRELEIGRSDRSRTKLAGRTYKVEGSDKESVFEGSGFQDFVGALYESFQRSLVLRRVLAGVKAELKQEYAKTKPNAQAIEGLNSQATLLNRQITTWMANWGGAQQRPIEQPGNSVVFDDAYDPISVPSGRQVLLVNDEEVEFNLWRNQNNPTQGSGATTTEGVVDTTVAEADEPF